MKQLPWLKGLMIWSPKSQNIEAVSTLGTFNCKPVCRGSGSEIDSNVLDLDQVS